MSDAKGALGRRSAAAVFMDEYKAPTGLVACTAPRALRLSKTVTAVPWFEMAAAIREAI